MSASDWTKILFVLLLVIGFGLPWVVYFVDVYKGVQAFPVPIIGPIKRRLIRLFGIGSQKEQDTAA